MNLLSLLKGTPVRKRKFKNNYFLFTFTHTLESLTITFT